MKCADAIAPLAPLGLMRSFVAGRTVQSGIRRRFPDKVPSKPVAAIDEVHPPSLPCLPIESAPSSY